MKSRKTGPQNWIILKMDPNFISKNRFFLFAAILNFFWKMSLIRSDICEPKTEMMKGEIELSRRSEETTFPGMGTSTNKNNLIGPTFTFWQ